MERRGLSELSNRVVQRGEIVFLPQVDELIAIAGANLIVTLWDSETKTAALVNFVKPITRDTKESYPIYGNVALLTIIKQFQEASIPLNRIEASLIGGGEKLLHSSLGAKNVKIAQKILNHHSIEIVSTDCGGSKGRKILFNTKNGEVALFKVHNLRLADWE